MLVRGSALISVFAFAASLSGCSVTSYLGQAAWGQLDLLSRRQPIDRLLRSGAAPPKLAALLSHVPEVRAFGTRQGLESQDIFLDYAELPRDAAVWIVTACPPLKLEARQWSFPLVGSVPYLGWFDRADAERHAETLRSQGLDVYVRGAAAYSTLGWFADPVLSTMIPRGAQRVGRLVNIVLHESVHATVYVNDQSFFNEAFATFVADELTAIYLAEQLGAHAPEKLAYEADRERGRAQQASMRRAYDDLSTLYKDASLPDAQKLERKAGIFESLQREVQARRPLNNAALVGMRVYDESRTAFSDALSSCGGRWGRLLAAAATLGGSDFAEPQQEDLRPVLALLVARCAASPSP